VEIIKFCKPVSVTVVTSTGENRPTFMGGPRESYRSQDKRWAKYLKLTVAGGQMGTGSMSAAVLHNPKYAAFVRESSARGMRGFVVKVILHPATSGQLFADADPTIQVIPKFERKSTGLNVMGAIGAGKSEVLLDTESRSQFKGWAFSFYQCEWKTHLGQAGGDSEWYYMGFDAYYKNNNAGGGEGGNPYTANSYVEVKFEAPTLNYCVIPQNFKQEPMKDMQTEPELYCPCLPRRCDCRSSVQYYQPPYFGLQEGPSQNNANTDAAAVKGKFGKILSTLPTTYGLPLNVDPVYGTPGNNVGGFSSTEAVPVNPPVIPAAVGKH